MGIGSAPGGSDFVLAPPYTQPLVDMPAPPNLGNIGCAWWVEAGLLWLQVRILGFKQRRAWAI
jgi:hypothetical protein